MKSNSSIPSDGREKRMPFAQQRISPVTYVSTERAPERGNCVLSFPSSCELPSTSFLHLV